MTVKRRFARAARGCSLRPHIHRAREERFEVLSGHRSFLAGTKWQTAGPGDTVVFSRHAARRSRPRRRGGPRGLPCSPVVVAAALPRTCVGSPCASEVLDGRRNRHLDASSWGRAETRAPGYPGWWRVGKSGRHSGRFLETDRPSSRNDGFPQPSGPTRRCARRGSHRRSQRYSCSRARSSHRVGLGRWYCWSSEGVTRGRR
jgi:hypothetical protein